jgi:hypothetical protein
MARMLPRCPICASKLMLEPEISGQALVCFGCGRRWELPARIQLDDEALTRIGAEITSGKRKPDRSG